MDSALKIESSRKNKFLIVKKKKTLALFMQKDLPLKKHLVKHWVLGLEKELI